MKINEQLDISEAIKFLREQEEEEIEVKEEEVEFDTFDDMMDFLAADEQEAIDGYEKIIALVEDEFVKEQLIKIKIEEEAHKKYLEEVKKDRTLEYTEPLEADVEEEAQEEVEEDEAEESKEENE